MITWPDPDRVVIVRYLGTLRLRSSNSRIYYRQVLDGFHDVAERYPVIDRQMLEVWLRKWGTCWHPSTLLHRSRIVDRFLDHLVETQMIASNPIAALRNEYSVTQSRPIWHALASPTPDQALAALRRPKPFGSVLGEIMRDHIALMRSRGYRYTTQASRFLRFDRFLQARSELACEPIAVMLEQWAAAKPSRNHAAECEMLSCSLTRALRHLDPSIPARRRDTRPQKEVARQFRKPHIYSPADVRRMLDIARSYPSPRAPLRPCSC
jgi:integrase/recombinase XerD